MDGVAGLSLHVDPGCCLQRPPVLLLGQGAGDQHPEVDPQLSSLLRWYVQSANPKATYRPVGR
jgi:hypothetical protein